MCFLRQFKQQQQQQQQLRHNQRLICIGDVHGDLWALQDFLEISGVYDRQLDEWIGGNTIVVQCGDILDRGVEELACYKLLCKLSQQAIHTDGKVILLVGNHEAMNSMGLFQYAINDLEHERKIGLAVDEELETPNWRIQYAKNQPSRWSSYEPGGLLATSLLANMKVAIRVGRTVCVHAGLRPSHLKDNGGIEGMNKQFRDWITLETGPGAVGPIWMRDYSYPHDQPPKDENGSTTRMIEETLLLLDCDRMIMGHTIQRQINCVLHGRAWRIDVGASRGCGSGTPEIKIKYRY
ncbi:Metallo-dependent phosphatase [Fragilariopsis cylindrus CCMP1102]|uniref:Metallo-dependent phosphatase n=1 Tax=Fragilariopsis cylindrus CCMP1102 TaxID=635003 RepID=A0A1E7FK04_9STRA|nr:Metallo-dependent phosphatase [Fragilariopsis cylindrus CCMP1102]|eukprot:OEU18365.1 Metallo-dependent phosphatase [Fragilariopsis cylindrus CCMP1102]